MSLSLGVLHTRLIPISFGYPYVSRQLVAPACTQRRGQPGVLSLAPTRLSDTIPPAPPSPPRLFPLFVAHQDWAQGFLASPTVLGVIDTYGIELIHPMREGRSPQQI